MGMVACGLGCDSLGGASKQRRNSVATSCVGEPEPNYTTEKYRVILYIKPRFRAKVVLYISRVPIWDFLKTFLFCCSREVFGQRSNPYFVATSLRRGPEPSYRILVQNGTNILCLYIYIANSCVGEPEPQSIRKEWKQYTLSIYLHCEFLRRRRITEYYYRMEQIYLVHVFTSRIPG